MGSISNIFGYILNYIYELIQNYGVSIIIFSVLLKIILLPLSIKQQKTMKKNTKIQVKVKTIQDKYRNNPDQMNKEIMELYKRENMSPFSGCLSSILQIIILLAMFYLVRSPLTFMKKIDSQTLEACKIEMTEDAGESVKTSAYPEINIIKYVNNFIKNGKKNETSIEKEDITDEESKKEDVINEVNKQNIIDENNEKTEADTVEEDNVLEKTDVNYDDLYINMEFLGLDLSNIPKENYQDITVYIIPLLYVITSIISMKLTTNMTKKESNKDEESLISVNNKEDKKEEKAEDMSQQMNKSMSLFLPIMSIMISLVAPLGLALYWLVNNILMIIERLVLNKILNDKELE